MKLITVALVALLTACSATSNLTKPGDYLAVTPALGAHETALLVSQGFQQCAHQTPTMNQAGPDTWQVLFLLPGSPAGEYFYAVQVSPGEARVAPLVHSNPMKRGCGLIAEWIEAGKITRCEPDDADLARWQ